MAEPGHEIHGFGALRYLEFGSANGTHVTPYALNRILADTIVLYDLYRKCQSVVRGGEGFDELQQVLDRHAMQQLELIDRIIECINMVGGVATTDARRVAEVTTITCPSDGNNDLGTILCWLLDVHELIRDKVRVAIDSSAKDGRNDPILEDAFRRNRLQARVLEVICQERRCVLGSSRSALLSSSGRRPEDRAQQREGR